MEISRGVATGLGILEETLTETTTNGIQFKHPDRFVTKRFTRKVEGNLSGADWLWCIGEPGAWISFAVQAKIASPGTGRVNYLHYRQGQQLDLLINFSRRFGLLPRYTIYSIPPATSVGLASRWRELRQFPTEQWSFSMVAPRYIAALKRSSDSELTRVLEYALPWSYAFQVNQTSRSSRSIAMNVAANLDKSYRRMKAIARSIKGDGRSGSTDRVNWQDPLPSRLLTTRIPLPILYLLTATHIGSTSPVSRVGLLSTMPANEAISIEVERVIHTLQWKRFPGVLDRMVDRHEEEMKYLQLEKL